MKPVRASAEAVRLEARKLASGLYAHRAVRLLFRVRQSDRFRAFSKR